MSSLFIKIVGGGKNIQMPQKQTVRWMRTIHIRHAMLVIIVLSFITYLHLANLKNTGVLVPKRELILLQVVLYNNGDQRFVHLFRSKFSFWQSLRLFRHGHRAPFQIIPSDPTPVSYWVEGLGTLTKLGRLQHYLVGEHLRNRYIDFLTLHPKEVHCLSSGAKRSHRGAYALLAGMYPPTTDRRIDGHLNWQPIPVEFRRESQDKYLQSTVTCPKSDKEKKWMYYNGEGGEFTAQHKHLYDFWSNCTGLHIPEYDKAGGIYKTLLLEKTLNLTIPQWAEDTWEELQHQADMAYYFNFASNLTHRLRGGPLIGKMLDKIRIKMANPEHPKRVYLYSGHGSNMAAVLNALRLFNNKNPPFTSFITMELYSSTDREVQPPQYSVRLLYTNGSNPEKDIPPPHVLVLPGCTEYCPFEYWVDYTAHLIPDNYTLECGVKPVKKKRRHIK